jgi:ABC-type branched-subunit amino acid transport system substrate-binding protein
VYANTAGAGATGTVFATTPQPSRDGVAASRWPAVYRTFVDGVRGRFGDATGSTEVQGSAAAADCVLAWARAVRRAGSLEGPAVARAWRSLDLPAQQTALGVEERFSGSSPGAVLPGGISIQEWVQSGGRRSLRALSGGA